MDNQCDYYRNEFSQLQFLASFDENLASVIESLRVIQLECEVFGDAVAARYLEAITTGIRAFASTHVPSTAVCRFGSGP